MNFDPTWPHGHVTRDGRKARVICTDRQSEHGYKIVALIMDSERVEQEICLMGNGQRWPSKSECDLLNAPAPKKKVWVALHEDGFWFDYPTREALDEKLKGHRLFSCIEVEEGQGLEEDSK